MKVTARDKLKSIEEQEKSILAKQKQQSVVWRYSKRIGQCSLCEQ